MFRKSPPSGQKVFSLFYNSLQTKLFPFPSLIWVTAHLQRQIVDACPWGVPQDFYKVHQQVSEEVLLIWLFIGINAIWYTCCFVFVAASPSTHINLSASIGGAGMGLNLDLERWWYLYFLLSDGLKLCWSYYYSCHSVFCILPLN